MRRLAPFLAVMACAGRQVPEAPLESRVPAQPATPPCGDTASANPAIAALTPKPLAAALPGKTALWESSWEDLVFEKDAPPNMAPVTAATIHYGRIGSSRTAQLAVVDMIHHCTCAPGAGRAMLAHDEREADGDRTRRLVIAGRQVLDARGTHHRKLSTYVGDRCHVYVHAVADSSAGELDELLAAVDFEALERACSAR